MSEHLVLLGTAVLAASGVPGLFLNKRAMAGQYLAICLAVLGGASGLVGVALFWTTGDSHDVVLSWPLLPDGPAHDGQFHVAMDGLSSIFLVPVFLVALLGSVYGLSYWKQTEHPDNGRKLRLFYGLLAAGMALLVVARNSLVFLFGWEIMALAAFFLITTEDQEAEVRASGWIYLVATHVATLCLFGLFALLRAANNGSYALIPVNAGSVSSSGLTLIFVLTLVGFGIKAGIMPLHVWLPSSHAIAPSHVSAIMSGVIIKMGIYGIVRVTSLLPSPPPEWGAVVLGLGVISGVLGVAFAIGQHDLKRLLAYHSIENIGIIVMGLGLALLGRALARDDWIVLGLAGALLHVWNHALFKALLFLSAGSVIHATGSREIDRLGGLAKLMPHTALGFLVGAVAICGLPPLNGFVSELLIYLGLFHTLENNTGSLLIALAFAVPALALIGALALACFVKVYGAVFLGTARSEHALHVHESGPSMIGPMAILAACCTLIGLAPLLVAPALGQAISAWAPKVSDGARQLEVLAPLGWISIMGVLLIGMILLAALGLYARLRAAPRCTAATWGCGYVAPTRRMQYTSSSFAQMLVELFAWALRPRTHKPKIAAIFPQETAFHSEVPDPVLDEAVLPTVRFGARVFSWFRFVQQGSIQAYLFYIFLALIALLLWH
jgi:hydrogenase-4 component B